MIKKMKVSIIIPVYNAEHYLGRCIDSVLNQTYNNIELILVNDGSSDKSPGICDSYANKDTRIKVIHKKNAGPSLARKDGIEIASGEYIAFVDADDYIDENMYEKLIEKSSNGADIVECGYREVSTEGKLIRELNLGSVSIDGSFYCALHFAANKNTTNFLWNKLYRAELLKNIKFPKLFAGEDSCILTQVYTYAEQVVNINESFYNYVMTPNSLCRQPFTEKKLDNIKAGIFMYEFYSNNLPDLCGFASLHICSYAAKLYCEIINVNIDAKQDKINYLLDNFNVFYKLSKNKLARNMSSKKRVIFIEIFHKSRSASMLLYNKF